MIYGEMLTPQVKRRKLVDSQDSQTKCGISTMELSLSRKIGIFQGGKSLKIVSSHSPYKVMGVIEFCDHCTPDCICGPYKR
jgi:hypothetical protein